ncbi:MAG: ATP-binding protein [Stellaceae bacterium]
MIGRRALRFCRIPALVLPVAAPGVVVLAGLAALGMLRPAAAFAGGGVVLVLTALVIARLVIATTALHDTIAALTIEPGLRPQPLWPQLLWKPLGLARAADQARRAILRVSEGWRAQLTGAQQQRDAAEAVLAAVPDPVILIDARRWVVGTNPATGDLFGRWSGPRDLAALLRNPAVLAAADAVLHGETARVVEFASPIPVERQLRARFARVADPLPGAPAAVLTLHDITELKRAEQMRADFVANASHELRTPLAALSGFIETLRGPARDDPVAGERFLTIMSEQAARMTRLVEDLLSLSRIERNEHVAPAGRIDLAPLLSHLAEALELRAGERGMQIRLDLPAGLPAVMGDRDELAQLFQNLFDNAIKYGDADSEIAVTVTMVTRRLAAANPAAGGFVAVAIRDHGAGIAREHLPRLTERFYRVDPAGSRELGGTGLGLAIVKHIVNRHRGFLEIDSTLGEGSVFTVLLRPAAAVTLMTGTDSLS